jgi:hypothetical protein
MPHCDTEQLFRELGEPASPLTEWSGRAQSGLREQNTTAIRRPATAFPKPNMAKNCDPSGQSWGTFLRNHAPHIAAMDLFVVPTVSFNLLYVLVIVRLARRELVRINVTAHATAECIAQQITEAFP